MSNNGQVTQGTSIGQVNSSVNSPRSISIASLKLYAKQIRLGYEWLTQVCDHTVGTSRLTELYRQQEQITQWIRENGDRHPLYLDAQFTLERVERLIAARESFNPVWPVLFQAKRKPIVVKPVHPHVNIGRILRNRKARAA